MTPAAKRCRCPTQNRLSSLNTDDVEAEPSRPTQGTGKRPTGRRPPQWRMPRESRMPRATCERLAMSAAMVWAVAVATKMPSLTVATALLARFGLNDRGGHPGSKHAESTNAQPEQSPCPKDHSEVRCKRGKGFDTKRGSPLRTRGRTGLYGLTKAVRFSSPPREARGRLRRRKVVSDIEIRVRGIRGIAAHLRALLGSSSGCPRDASSVSGPTLQTAGPRDPLIRVVHQAQRRSG
jgi:hypothetical protein